MILLNVSSIDHISENALLALLFVVVVGTIVVGAVAFVKTAAQTGGELTRTDQGILPDLVGRLSMFVDGHDRTSAPLNLRFTLSDPSVTLLRIEIANQLDKGAESAECVKQGPGVFIASVGPKIVQRWYDANPYWDGETKQLPIRASFTTNGRAAYQTIWVRMSPRSIASSGVADIDDFGWFVGGQCAPARPTISLVPSRTRTSRGVSRVNGEPNQNLERIS